MEKLVRSEIIPIFVLLLILYDMTDQEKVKKILDGDEHFINRFLEDECAGIIKYGFHHYFDNEAEKVKFAYDDVWALSQFTEYLRKNDWEKLRKYDGSGKLKHYLGVIAYRYFGDLRKHVNSINKKTFSATNGFEDKGMDKNANTDKFFTDEEGLLSSEELMGEAIDLMLDKNARYHDVLEMYFYRDMSVAQIAAAFNDKASNISNIKKRALTMLQNIYMDLKTTRK